MNISNVIKKAKALLSTVKLSQEVTDSGLTIQYDGDSLEVGAVVYFQDEAGDWAVLADGEYTLESGIKFTITDGSVSAIDKPASEEPATVEQAMDEETIEEVVESVEDVVNRIVDEKMAPVLEALEAIKAQLSTSTEQLSATQTALSSVSDTVVLLSKQPSAQPIQTEVNAFRKPSKEVTESRAYKILNS